MKKWKLIGFSVFLSSCSVYDRVPIGSSGSDKLFQDTPNVAASLGGAAEIAMWFVGAWIVFEVLRLGFRGFGIGNGASGILGGLNNFFNRAPGSGGGGHPTDLAPVVKEIQELRKENKEHATHLNEHMEAVRRVLDDVKTLATEIRDGIAGIIASLGAWDAYFKATVQPAIQGILDEVNSLGTIAKEHRDDLRAIKDAVVGKLVPTLEQVRDILKTQFEALQIKLDQLLGLVTNIEAEVKKVTAEIVKVTTKLEEVKTAIIALPEGIRAKLDARLEEIVNAINAIKVDFDDKEIIKAVKANATAITKAINGAKNGIIKAGEANVWGAGSSSMITKLLAAIEKLKEGLDKGATGGPIAKDKAIQLILEIKGDNNHVHDLIKKGNIDIAGLGKATLDEVAKKFPKDAFALLQKIINDTIALDKL
ncbi:MAG TPA: hypothetical protein VJH88_06335, partial [Candidatus Nanoarchaeia archaeon]|nr:hypothetical protein [Candidatus Nanoarchaeia archaeon]